MNDENFIYSPKTPYVAVIPGGLYPGKAILIKGLALAGRDKQLCVNLSTGLLVDGDTMDDIVLHLNPRFNEHTVVLNTLTANRWGAEIINKNPLKIGQAVEIRILCLTEYYSIALNGRHLANYYHRLPMSSVKTLYVKGCLQIDLIQYEEGFSEGATPAGASSMVAPAGAVVTNLPDEGKSPAGKVGSPSNTPVFRPTVPYVASVAPMVPGRQIFITGTPKPHCQQFTLNFKIKNDIAFHLDVRLYKNEVVRNSEKSGKWGPEERTIPHMPFLPSGTFDMQILCDTDGFKLSDQSLTIVMQYVFQVAVNGQHFIAFVHRMPAQQIDTFEIRGDIALQQVVI